MGKSSTLQSTLVQNVRDSLRVYIQSTTICRNRKLASRKSLQVQKLKGTGRGILCHSSISPSKQLKFDSSINSSRTDGRIKRKWYQRRISRVIVHRKRLNMCLLEEKQLKSPD